MNDEFPFVIATLLEQCGNSKDIAEIILEEFVVQIGDDIREITASLASGDLLQVGKVGHRLKGSSGVVGAEHLHSLCLAIEQTAKNAAKEGATAEVAKIFAELKAEADRCVAAVPKAKEKL